MNVFGAFRASFTISILLVASSFFANTSGASAPAGRVVSAAGNVLVRNESAAPGSGGSKVRPLAAGETVSAGDVINTGSDASVKLLMTDQSILDLGPSLLFKIDEYQLKHGADRKVAMTLGYGKMRASVNTPVGKQGKFTVRTRAATMGVRGTEFILAADVMSTNTPSREQVQTQLTVVEGKVEVSQAATPQKAPVAVTQGQQITTLAEVSENRQSGTTTVRQEAPAQVVQLSKEQVTQAVRESKVADTTFKNAVSLVSESGGTHALGGASMADLDRALSKTLTGNIEGLIPPPLGANLAGTTPYLPPGQPVRIQVVFKK